jgi:hypothetical protein
MDNFKYEIIDNFLPAEEHLAIEDFLIGEGAFFPWYFNNYKSADDNLMKGDSLDNYQFTHTFHLNHTITSEHYSRNVFPIVQKLKPLSIVRIKANLNPKTDTPIKYGWHVDYPNYKHKTAIYYVNSNNGKTFFKNGLEVDSVANRIVIFDGNMQHTGSSCTDQKARCVINFNYIEENK